tara:strand:- start:229 stop:564 length:336 start_codon:yes stop_codon:yes gene_type:complete
MRRNYKWNISKEEGIQIINDKIKEILLDSNNKMELSELNFAIQNRTKNIIIMNNKKKKNISNFIKVVMGGLRPYLEKNKELYTIIHHDSKQYIQLNKGNIFSEWIIIDDDY